MNHSTHSEIEHQRFEEIDVLRFVAAMWVVLFHFYFRHWNLDGSGHQEFGFISKVSQYGYLGVDIFFLISGFVISYSASGQSVRGFARSRAARLLPAYWFSAIVIYAFALTWPVPNYSVSLPDFAINLPMLQGYFNRPNISTVFWTLVVELNFYVIIGLVIYFKAMRHLLWMLWLWLLVAALAADVEFPKWIKFILITDWAHYFIAGAVCFLIRMRGLSLGRLLLLAFCLGVAVRRAYWYMLLKERLSGVDYEPIIVGLIILAAFTGFLALALVKKRLSFGRLTGLGVLTYPLYLIHSTIGHALINAWSPNTGTGYSVVAVVITMLIIAYGIHEWIEKPGAKIIKRLLR